MITAFVGPRQVRREYHYAPTTPDIHGFVNDYRRRRPSADAESTTTVDETVYHYLNYRRVNDYFHNDHDVRSDRTPPIPHASKVYRWDMSCTVC